MKRQPLKLPFEYRDTLDFRVLDLTPDGIRCIPVLGRTRLRAAGLSTTSDEHVHDECVEISFCQRGELVFESMGRDYSFNPGMVFVSRPNERHRLRVFPKGLLMYWLFPHFYYSYLIFPFYILNYFFLFENKHKLYQN